MSFRRLAKCLFGQPAANRSQTRAASQRHGAKSIPGRGLNGSAALLSLAARFGVGQIVSRSRRQRRRRLQFRPRVLIAVWWPFRRDSLLATLVDMAPTYAFANGPGGSFRACPDWLFCQSASATASGAIPSDCHHAISFAARCTSRWCARHNGTVYSSLTFRPRARGCANGR
jgi:hypothetical protein